MLRIRAAQRPTLAVGDLVLFEEVKGVEPGAAPDAGHRQIVRVIEVEDVEDPLYASTLDSSGRLVARNGSPALPLTRIRWSRDDALRFPLCLSSRAPGADLVEGISVARGNLVLADHGQTVDEQVADPPPLSDELRFYRLPLRLAPLTMECRPFWSPLEPQDRGDLSCDVRAAKPTVWVEISFPGPIVERWTPVDDLLDATEFDETFVVEVDEGGRAILRFGDGVNGRRVDDATRFRTVYRTGNGRAGNVGVDALAHVAVGSPAAFTWLVGVRNPLAAQGGVDPETIEETRQRAPLAFRADQPRAVTEQDWAAAAEKQAGVDGAVASFRWTGSWYTVFVAIDPSDPQALVDDAVGHLVLEPSFEQRLRDALTGYRLAGYELELRPPEFAPLDIAVDVCARPGYFRGDVAQAVRNALSARDLGGGRRGFFHRSNFSFGQPVFLSRLYAAVERVDGVDSLVVTRFQRYGRPENGELAAGTIAVGRFEVAQLENDPNFLERGALAVNVRGGSG